ncbi:MAG: hypothetical protein LBT59_21655 [Clostridiales bacterium]|jgi:hypothetical protein|nr:hypothetical protein [Clostridiales bacterium]
MDKRKKGKTYEQARQGKQPVAQESEGLEQKVKKWYAAYKGDDALGDYSIQFGVNKVRALKDLMTYALQMPNDDDRRIKGELV